MMCSIVAAPFINAQTPEQLKIWMPGINGWDLSEKVEVFNPDNLYDRINGSAPLFIENNFREMTAMEYIDGDDYITIQAYRHATPEDAFGMYASERSSEMENFPIGGEAQGDNTNIYFFAGCMYVKIWDNSVEPDGIAIRSIATELANKIDPDADYPGIFAVFPADGKQPYTQSYVTSNYIGHNFLTNVYYAKYLLDGSAFDLFVIDGGNKEDAKSILDKYFSFTKQDKAIEEGLLTIRDRYNGDIPVVWNERYIIGIFSEDGNAILQAESLLTGVSDRFTNKE